jgi:hypothetical protein
MRLRNGFGALGIVAAAWLGALVIFWPAAGGADVPWPTCAAAGCSDPADFASYLFVPPGTLPNDYDPNDGEAWKYAPGSGMDIPGIWESTTGRPDVVIAVLDSGNYWDNGELARKVALNTGELPVPDGCTTHDCNGDGFVSVTDFADACAANPNGNGHCDGQDLIRFYQDGVDDDGNGFVDDIAGWDFADDDNDPEDEVRYGHGNGEASDEVAEANNGGGFPGFAPSTMYIPLKVADSFIAIDQEFARAVVYAVDRRVDVISEALGTVNASASGQAAVDYAYRNGIPLIASAADEESRHHNYPAAYGHVIWVNSVTRGDGTFLDANANGYDVLNGCTNYSGKAWLAIPSSACSSEATSRAGGLAALLVSHAQNLVDRGELLPYPGLATPFSSEEVRQLLRLSARDVDHSASPEVVMSQPVGNLVSSLLSAPLLGLYFGTSRFPTQEGWDQFTGYGRPDGRPLLALVTPTTIPPEADLTGGPAWFDTIDPVATPNVALIGSARAVRAGNDFSWQLEIGCGVQPLSYESLASGAGAGAPLEDAVLAAWSPTATAATCGFDPSEPIDDPDAHTVTLRLRVTDFRGNVGEDRRTLAIHHDPALRYARRLAGSGESSPALADVNRDGVLDIVRGGGDGSVRAIDGATGADLPGFPVWTDEIGESLSFGYTSGQVPIPHEAVIASVAADDLDGDGRVEIVAAGMRGGLYVFDDHGGRRPGFPVTTDPALSDPANRDPLNDTAPGIVGAPTLVDLDPPGADPALEIAHSSLDGHLYAWRADGSPVSGFPVRLADRTMVSIDPATGKATAPPPPAPRVVRDRAAKSLSSPAAGDLDGDGRPELVVATNEEYRDGSGPSTFAIESPLLGVLASLLPLVDLEDLRLDTTGRVYAVKPEGNAAAGGPFLSGWPVSVPLLAPGILPTVGTGTPGAPAIAVVDGAPRVMIFGAIGPIVLVNGAGEPALGEIGGLPRVLAHDFPAGFPEVPATAGSPDAPFFGALGAAAVGDITGDGAPELVAPTGGLRKLLDVAVSAQQGLADAPTPTGFVTEGIAHHQISAWSAATGALLPAFPRVMEDMQFIGSPALADVDGDGVAEVLNGSGVYQVRAYRADGSMPAGWPKFTHGWHIASPTAGDVDGDGLTEVVAFTREGQLFVWDTPAPASEAALPWTGFGRDRRNTQNQASGVPSTAPPVDALAGLGWQLESLQADLERLAAELPLAQARLLRRSAAPNLIPLALQHLEDDQEHRLSALLPGIEYGLLLPGSPIAGLAPLEARFRAAVRATLERLIDGGCGGSPGAPQRACDTATTWAPVFLMFGDQRNAAGNPSEAVRYWAWGIALYDAT